MTNAQRLIALVHPAITDEQRARMRVRHIIELIAFVLALIATVTR